MVPGLQQSKKLKTSLSTSFLSTSYVLGALSCLCTCQIHVYPSPHPPQVLQPSTCLVQFVLRDRLVLGLESSPHTPPAPAQTPHTGLGLLEKRQQGSWGIP